MIQSFEHMHDVHASEEYEFKTAGCELPAWDRAAVSKFLAHMAGKSLLLFRGRLDHGQLVGVLRVHAE